MTGIFSVQSDRAGNFTRAQAAGAGVDILRGTLDDRLHALDIGVPGTVAPTMRVGNLDTERDTLATARTFGHNCLHLLFNSLNIIAWIFANCKGFVQKSLKNIIFSFVWAKSGRNSAIHRPAGLVLGALLRYNRMRF